MTEMLTPVLLTREGSPILMCKQKPDTPQKELDGLERHRDYILEETQGVGISFEGCEIGVGVEVLPKS